MDNNIDSEPGKYISDDPPAKFKDSYQKDSMSTATDSACLSFL